MNSRNSVIRGIAEKCCSWGARTTVPSSNYVGGPVPLLRNPAVRFFKFLVILNLVFMIVCILVFVI